jgi:hypothetical protein
MDFQGNWPNESGAGDAIYKNTTSGEKGQKRIS